MLIFILFCFVRGFFAQPLPLLGYKPQRAITLTPTLSQRERELRRAASGSRGELSQAASGSRGELSQAASGSLSRFAGEGWGEGI